STSLAIKHQQIVLLLNIADIETDLGNGSQALKRTKDAEELTLQLVDVQSEESQGHLYAASFRLGDGLVGEEARKQYIAAKDIAAELGAEVQSKLEGKLGLARELDKIGDKYEVERIFAGARKESLQALQTAADLTDIDTATADWKHQESASHNRIGDAWRQQG